MVHLTLQTWVVLWLWTSARAVAFAPSAEEIMEKRIAANYSKGRRPRPAGKAQEATIVTINIYIHSISMVDELRTEYTADVFLRQFWNDPRLAYADSEEIKNASYVRLGNDSPTPQIWVPDIFFSTMRKGETVNLAVPNRGLRIYPSGDILYSVRYIVTLGCDMDFRLYPFDTQQCVTGIELFSSTLDAVVLKWHPETVFIRKDLKLPKFILEDYSTSDCFVAYELIGNFSCVKFQLNFKRLLLFHIVEAFLPTSLLVAASWIGFWLDASAGPSRVSLSSILMLSTITLNNYVKSSLPQVSYVKSIDIWFGVCIAFIFLTFLESGIVIYLFRRDGPAESYAREERAIENKPRSPSPDKPSEEKWSPRKDPHRVSSKSNVAIVTGVKTTSTARSNQEDSPRMKPGQPMSHYIVDVVSRILFPIAFMVFVVLFATNLRFLPIYL